jgi:general L-amino acid transport system permease protein
MSETVKYEFSPGTHPDLPPPMRTAGIIGWSRKNLFSSPLNIIMSLLVLLMLWEIIPQFYEWAVINSVISADSRQQCWEQMVYPDAGACWAFIIDRVQLFTYGFYPPDLRWRVNISFLLLALAVVPVLYEKLPYRKYGLIYSAVFPFIAGWLLVGGLGLETVDTDQFGGIMLTLILGVTGISFSLPIGVVLALGRQSNMPVLKILCVLFIEFFRGVPLITLLFVASTMLNYFLPPGTDYALLMRVIIMVTLFASAYMAEVIRGGLQAIDKGQHEAGDSLGLKYWQANRLIILPQALKISIPGIVNTFIGLYKDTTLVLIIGMMDILGLGQASLSDAKWSGLAFEIYIFVALYFFVSCFSMSRYSLYLEKKLHTGH